MAKTYRPYSPDQMFLLPPSLRDWLPDNHLVYFVSDVVDQLDLSKIESVYERDDRGQPPYNPRMMTKILVYAYCSGVFSSRRIQKRLVEDIAFRVLAAGNQPDFRTISDFRKIHLDALQNLFEQVLKLAMTAGAVKLGRVALDGSKIKANASKHKAMSYKRMKEEQRRLRVEVRGLLKQAKNTDDDEDSLYGKNKRGDELPEELSRRETRLQRIKEANDKKQLIPMVESIKAQAGQTPTQLLADSGYCSEDNLKSLKKKRLNGFIATGRQKHAKRGTPCKRGPLPQGATQTDKMTRKLQTKKGSAVYAARKTIVEPVFGQIKQARGFRQFLLRGIHKVRAEWALVCATHNILKMYRFYYA